MKKLFTYTIMCFLYITFTATTCDDIDYRTVCIRNNTSDTILLGTVFFIVSGPEKNSGKGRRAHQLHGEKFRSQREIFLSQRKNNGQYGPKKRRKPSVFGLSPLHYTNIQHFSAKSKSY